MSIFFITEYNFCILMAENNDKMMEKLCNAFVNNVSKQNNVKAMQCLEKILKNKVSERIKTTLAETTSSKTTKTGKTAKK